MKKDRVLWLVWSVWALTVVIIIAEEIFGYLNDPSLTLSAALYGLVLLAFATVGALIISRRAENRIGWLLAGGTFLLSLGGLALEYAVYTLLIAPRALPGGEWMLWFGGWVRSLGFFTLVIFVPLLFPNGRVPSPRWRRVAWLAVGDVVLATVVNIFAPTQEQELRLPPLPNPLGIIIPPNIYQPLNGISFVGLGILMLLVAASVVIRFRRAAGEERQQLKWFAYAGVVAAIIFAFILIGTFTLPDVVMTKIGGTLFSLLLAGFPIALGIAILKYRLYEIDLLINRTLVYVPLTAILAGIFSASITLTQKFFVAITGQTSDAATVFTTLIVVAAFEPLKSGLQTLVDKKFEQAPDAAKELKQFEDQVRAVVQVTRVDQLTRRLLETTVRAFDARGGAVYLGSDGNLQLAQSLGEWNGEVELAVPMSSAERAVQLGVINLGARRNGAEYSARDRETLQQIANLVALAIEAARNE